VPVGITDIHLRFDVHSGTADEQWATLFTLTELWRHRRRRCTRRNCFRPRCSPVQLDDA